jgi:hypothetical protein
VYLTGEKMNRVLKSVKINSVRIDGDTQSRVDIDANWVSGIVDDLKNDIDYDPIEARFDGVHYWLTDGFHRYLANKQIGAKEIRVAYLPGTQLDAQIDSFSANSKHGKPRTRADKQKAVEKALAHPQLQGKTNYEIAKICQVSQPFVAAVRDPAKKKKQTENVEKHYKAKVEENTNSISSEKPTDREITYQDCGPDEAELKANELALQADQDAMYQLLESDDALAVAYEEIKRLNYLNAQLEVRINGLMNEKNEAIKMVKALQKENDKLKGKK